MKKITNLVVSSIFILSLSVQARTLRMSLVDHNKTIDYSEVHIGSDDEKTVYLKNVAFCKATTVAADQSVGIVEIKSDDGGRSVAIGGVATAGLLDTRINGRVQTINCAIVD